MNRAASVIPTTTALTILLLLTLLQQHSIQSASISPPSSSSSSATSFPWPCQQHADCISRIGWYGGCYDGRCREMLPTVEHRICTGFFHCHHPVTGERGQCNGKTQRCHFPDSRKVGRKSSLNLNTVDEVL